MRTKLLFFGIACMVLSAVVGVFNIALGELYSNDNGTYFLHPGCIFSNNLTGTSSYYCYPTPGQPTDNNNNQTNRTF